LFGFWFAKKLNKKEKTKMINYEEFKQMKEMQALGKTQSEIVKKLGINKREMERFWDKSEAEFFKLEQGKMDYLENYRSYILDILKVTPQIRGANMLYKLREAFPDFASSTPTFYRYLKKLREEVGLAQFAKRVHSTRVREAAGEEAQVDFGQYKMKTMYGTNVKVYFFCMVLSYSSMRFVYFQADPFTTAAAVQAHEYAFQYFGGRTRQIMYDLDRVFVSTENFGNLILVKEFEDFVKRTGFVTTFCKPRDPNTKGRVENLVGFIKYNFLEGRTYTGIDALNASALRWLDTTGNEVVNDKKYFSPREMFREESKHLIPVAVAKPKRQLYEVNKGNTVKYHGNFYEMPTGTFLLMNRVRVEEMDGEVCFYNLDTTELVCRHELADGENKIVPSGQAKATGIKTLEMQDYFMGDELYEKYMQGVKTKLPRYVNKQNFALKKAARVYSKEEMRLAFKHCIEKDECNIAEFVPYLIYKFGRDKAKKFLPQVTLYNYQIRAEQIAEEYYGK
jgi:transposase